MIISTWEQHSIVYQHWKRREEVFSLFLTFCPTIMFMIVDVRKFIIYEIQNYLPFRTITDNYCDFFSQLLFILGLIAPKFIEKFQYSPHYVRAILKIFKWKEALLIPNHPKPIEIFVYIREGDYKIRVITD